MDLAASSPRLSTLRGQYCIPWELNTLLSTVEEQQWQSGSLRGTQLASGGAPALDVSMVSNVGLALVEGFGRLGTPRSGLVVV